MKVLAKIPLTLKLPATHPYNARAHYSARALINQSLIHLI